MTSNELVTVVKAAQSGDNAAIEKLFKEYNQQVYYSALLIVKNEELAKDITQETFITVIRKISELENPEAFPAWIKKIAQSKCSDYYKKKEVVHETTISSDEDDAPDVFGSIQEDDSEFIPDEALDRDDLKRVILSILNELPEVQRAAIFMRYYEEMSVKEIAEVQGVSEGTVMSRLNYGRKAIAKAVEDYEKENDIKLHALPFLPFFHWIFEATKNQATPKIVGDIASGVTQATGVSISVSTTSATAAATATATAGGFAAKIASIPLVAKIAVPVIVAATLITPAVIKNNQQPAVTETTLQVTEVMQTEIVTETTTEETTAETTTETTEIVTTQAPVYIPEIVEEELDEDIYEIYEDPEELVEDDGDFVDDGEKSGVKMDGTTAPR